MLIATGAILDIAEVEIAPLTFVRNPVIALLVGLIGTILVTRRAVGRPAMDEAQRNGFRESGQIPLLLVWVVAAILHIGVGSVSISAITAAGILAPVALAIGLDAVWIALAAGAGRCSPSTSPATPSGCCSRCAD